MKPLPASRFPAVVFILAILLVLAACGGPRPAALPEDLARAHENFSRATMHYKKGCFRQALEGYQAAHELFSAADDQRGVGLALESMANVYHELEDTESALLLYDEALDVFSAAGFEKERIYVLANKAAALVSIGKLEQAAKVLDRAKILARRNGFMPVLAQRVGGLLLLHRKQFKEAETVLEKALRQAVGPQADQWAPTAFTLARVMEASGRQERALVLYRRALERDRRQGAYDQVAEDLAALGYLYAGSKTPCKGIDFFKRAAKIEALLGRSAKAADLAERLEDLARTCGTDSTAADFFISKWAGGQSLINICR